MLAAVGPPAAYCFTGSRGRARPSLECQACRSLRAPSPPWLPMACCGEHLELPFLCPGVSWNVLECPGMSWSVLECPGVSWSVLECTPKHPDNTLCHTPKHPDNTLCHTP
eukprot:366430-Chlamydomonas_euryale.AAC.14